MTNRILLVVGLIISLGCGGLLGGDKGAVSTDGQGVGELNAALDELDASLKLAEVSGAPALPAETLQAATERLGQAKTVLEPAIQQATQ